MASMYKTVSAMHGACSTKSASFSDEAHDLAISEWRESFNKRYAHEPEFLQAHGEILNSLIPVFHKDMKYFEIFKICSEPERIVSFRVCWTDDQGKLQTNRAYRVQYNSALGPYKGGLRLHHSVNLGILKFLGFEQIFKNSLTTLAMGGGKGGSDFDPKGKSDNEVRSFCQAFMTELVRHIGPDTDVPAGDIGTGGREIGFMYGQWHKLTNTHGGVLTGKGMSWGGSHIRPEATGYGAVFYAENMIRHFGLTPNSGSPSSGFQNMQCVVSGSGNAAQYTCEKLLHLGAKVLSCSDSNGTLYFPSGMSLKDLETIKELKNVKRGRLSEVAFSGAEYIADKKPWDLCDVDFAFPAATQNEICVEDAKTLIAHKCQAVVEVSNMSTTDEAIKLIKASCLYAPGKASNAGGVAVSGLEMSQNAGKVCWTPEKAEGELRRIMDDIFNTCVTRSKEYYGTDRDLQNGANIGGFMKVADAMYEQGLF